MVRTKTKKPKEKPFVGEAGLVLVEYRGNVPGVRRWPSSLDGTAYYFGTERRRGYVDARDMVAFIGVQEPGFMDGPQRTFGAVVRRGTASQDD